MSEKIWVRHERGGLVLLAVAVEPLAGDDF